MKKYIHYFVIPLVVIGVSAIGGVFTNSGLGSWYQTLRLPPWTPEGSFIGAVWTALFILLAISAILAYNATRGKRRVAVMTAYAINGILNIGWSFLFFGQHLIYLAFWEALLLLFSIVFIMWGVWRKSIWAGILLIPYALWVEFASFLTYVIWTLNG